MNQQLTFPEPITVGTLAPLTRVKHGKCIATITGYRLPIRSTDVFVLCRADDGEEFELADDAVVEVVEECMTLESCVCGEHVDCPDGFHSAAEMPCICTPGCVASDPKLHEYDGSGGAEPCAHCEQDEGAHS